MGLIALRKTPLTLLTALFLLAWAWAPPASAQAYPPHPAQGQPAADDENGLIPLHPYAPPPQHPDRREGWIAGIALDAARRQMGDVMPTGRGIVFGHVEGAADSYAPDATLDRFLGVRFILHDKDGKPNGHATATARVIYGPNGAAPGVATVHVFPVQPWLTDAYLRTGRLQPPVDRPKVRVFSHSWIAPPSPFATLALRRVDYLIDARDILIVAGVNNGGRTEVPALLGSSYNAIAVGLANGNNSSSYTRVEGEGRCKPDIVAPSQQTSFSTPIVAAMAARLLELADRTRDDPSDNRAETIKAAIMAGAFKPPQWKPEKGKPLDRRLGAGIIDIDRAILILRGGNTDPGPFIKRHGYAFQPIDADQTHAYTFRADQPLGQVSLLLTWHRRISGPRLTQARLPNLDLILQRQTEDGWQTTAQSTAAIDNAEHIYRPKLPPGRYRILVRRGQDTFADDWDYALAWRLEHPQ